MYDADGGGFVYAAILLGQGSPRDFALSRHAVILSYVVKDFVVFGGRE